MKTAFFSRVAIKASLTLSDKIPNSTVIKISGANGNGVRMGNAGKSRIIILGILLGMAAFGIYFIYKSKIKTPGNDPIIQENMYKNYKFNEPGTIYMGTQPLYSPTGLITETIKRDKILEKYLKKKNLTLKYYPFLKGKDVNSYMRTGNIQIGVGGDMPAITMAATGEIVIPSVIQRGKTWIVTRTPITFAEIKGMQIGYAPGSNAHYMLLDYIVSMGLSETDVRLIPLDINNMIKSMTDKKIEAFAAWEPTPSIAIKKHGYSSDYGSQSLGYLYMRKDFSEEYPDLFKQIIAAEIRAINWLRKSIENISSAGIWAKNAIQHLTGENYLLSPEELVLIAEKDILSKYDSQSFYVKKDTALMKKVIKKKYDLLVKLGKITEDTDFEIVIDCFDEKVIQHIMNNSMEYRLNEAEYK